MTYLTRKEIGALIGISGANLGARIKPTPPKRVYIGYEGFPESITGSYPLLYEAAAVVDFIAKLPEERSPVTCKRTVQKQKQNYTYQGPALTSILFLQPSLLAQHGGYDVL